MVWKRCGQKGKMIQVMRRKKSRGEGKKMYMQVTCTQIHSIVLVPLFRGIDWKNHIHAPNCGVSVYFLCVTLWGEPHIKNLELCLPI